MRMVCRMVTVLAMLPGGVAIAEPDTVILDLARVQRLAETRAPEARLAELAATSRRAEAMLDALGPGLAPSVQLEGGPCLNGGVTACAGGSVTFPLPLPGEARAWRLLGRAGISAANLDSAAARWRVRYAAGVAYLRAVTARRLSRLAADALAIARRLADVVRRRTREGDAARLDEMQIQGRVLRRQREAASAAFEERAAEGALRRLLLLRSRRLAFREDLVQASAAALRAAASRTREHPRIRALRAVARRERARVEVARRQRWPRIALWGGYRWEQVHIPFVGVSVPLLPLSEVPRAELQRARAGAWRAQEEAELLARELTIALDAARRRLVESRRIVQVAQAEEERTRAVLRLLTDGYRLGQVDLVRLLVAEDAALGAARERVVATRAMGEAALLVAAGGAP